MSTAEEEERQVSLASEASASPLPSATKLCNAIFSPKDSEAVNETCDNIDSSHPEHQSLLNSNIIIGVKSNSSIPFIGQNGDDKTIGSLDNEDITKTNGEERDNSKRDGHIDFEENDLDFSESVTKETVQIILTAEQLATLSKEELIEKWNLQEHYTSTLQAKLDATIHEVNELKKTRLNDERLKSQLSEIQRKEQYHIMRLATKEHEIQELGAQVDELKNLAAGGGSLKNSLLDPAVNLLYERMKRDFDSTKAKMEETQNELAAWKFTPDSNTGKQLMAKCRLLIKENEELGKMISSGRLAKLEGDLALQRSFSDELKKSQSELEEFLQEMDEDTEGMQGTILYLQSQLRQAKEKISHLTSQVSMGQGTSNNTPASTGEPTEYTEGSFSEIGLEPIHNEDSLQQYPDEGRTLLESSDKILLKESDHNDESILTAKPNGDLLANINNLTGSGEFSHSSDGSNTHINAVSNGRKRTLSVLEESGNDDEDCIRSPSASKRTRIERTDEGGEGDGVHSDQVVENGLSME